MAVHRKAVALMDPIEAVARLAARAGERAEAAQTRASGSASYDNGDGTRTVIGPQTGSATMATHVGDTTPPGRPLGVAGASSAGVVYIAWDGRLEGGIPADFDHVTCYMTVDGVDEAVGTLTEAGIVSTVPMATATTVEVWATAEDDACLADGTPAHNVSAESDHAAVKVTQAEDRAAVDALRDRLSRVEANAATAQSTANAAKGTADGLATLIRADSTGITVGKSADGETWSTGRTRMTDSAFQVLDKAGAIIAQLAGDGASFLSGLVRIVAGKVSLPGADSVDSITIDAGGGVATVSGLISRLSGLYNGISSTVTAGFATYGGNGITATVRDTESDIVANATLGVDKATVGIGGQYVKMKGDAFELSNPEYLLSALMDTRKVPGSLDTCGPGVFTYNVSTANRPTDWGVCLSFVAASGNWLFQLALPTAGDPHWRRNINGGGWTSWWTITSQ